MDYTWQPVSDVQKTGRFHRENEEKSKPVDDKK